MEDDRLIWLNKERNELETKFDEFKEARMTEMFGENWLDIFQNDMGEKGHEVRVGFMNMVKEFKALNPTFASERSDI